MTLTKWKSRLILSFIYNMSVQYSDGMRYETSRPWIFQCAPHWWTCINSFSVHFFSFLVLYLQSALYVLPISCQEVPWSILAFFQYFQFSQFTLTARISPVIFYIDCAPQLHSLVVTETFSKHNFADIFRRQFVDAFPSWILRIYHFYSAYHSRSPYSYLLNGKIRYRWYKSKI